MTRQDTNRKLSLQTQLFVLPTVWLRSILVCLAALPLLTGVGCGTFGVGSSRTGMLLSERRPDTAASEDQHGRTSEPVTRVVEGYLRDDSTRQTNVPLREPNSAEPGSAEPGSADATAGVILPAAVVSASFSETSEMTTVAECPELQYCGNECLSGCTGSCVNCQLPASLRMNAQEYIFDGGDQQPTVVIREDWSSVGVDPTDTVAYYETEDGLVCVKPTNRVPIYAPRFGAVRQVRGAMLAERAVGTQRILAPIKPGRFDETDLAGTVMQPLGPAGEEQVNLIDAFQENSLGTPIEQIIPPLRMSEARVPFENIDVLGTGRITDEEIAVLGQFMQNALTWYKPELLEIIIDGQEAALLTKVKSPQDVLVYEPPGDKCALRICKTASHTLADSGDTVRFTIRFDNAGVTLIRNAVIMDSLSPRLEYIEGSQQSSVEVRFSAEDNEVGSQVLKWEIASPIDPNEGGVISFDCLVR